MLRTRILTAVAILPVLLGMLFLAPPAAWALFVLAIALLGCWEWSRLAALAAGAERAFLGVSGVAGAVLWLAYLRVGDAAFAGIALAAFALATAFWVAFAPWWLARHLRPGPAARCAAGWLVVWPTWIAFVVLRDASPWLLLALALLVWIADIAAYFAGRRFGRHKLAPRVSPGKTWEGVAGALAGVAVYGAILAWVSRGHATPVSGLFEAGLGVPAIAAMLVLAGLGVVGDLFESWMKRGAGLKDSSQLLPGHGGVLDRIDALTSSCRWRRSRSWRCDEAAGTAPVKTIAILGATGSIGKSTLDVVARHPGRYRVGALAAARNDAALLEQCRAHRPDHAVLADPDAAARLQAAVHAEGLPTAVLQGAEALERIAAAPGIDAVMAAIVGGAGLPATIAAAAAGKEAAARQQGGARDVRGALHRRRRARRGHAAAHRQRALRDLPVAAARLRVRARRGAARGVRGARIVLTASGGPFRTLPLERLAAVTPDEACAHPNWVMGRKISVDSATMMNKALEVIEAHWLFGAPLGAIEVVLHPQSVIHSMVEYRDGSVIAQLGAPDMRTPIACALAWPERIASGVAPLDFAALGRLEFERVEPARFPCLALAAEAIRRGGTAPAALNAANEVAVEAFLAGRLAFTGIPRVIEGVLSEIAIAPLDTLEAVYAVDREARERAARLASREAERASVMP